MNINKIVLAVGDNHIKEIISNEELGALIKFLLKNEYDIKISLDDQFAVIEYDTAASLGLGNPRLEWVKEDYE